MGDKWEDGFDSWTPREQANGADDTGTDLDREALLKLARELAARRQAERTDSDGELERLKQTLRERAEAIAARERELEALERRTGKGAKRERKEDAPDAAAAVAARERAALERARTLDARERELKQRFAQLEREFDDLGRREEALEEELARARAEVRESRSERELAHAERAQLELRADEARRVEQELANRRRELEALISRGGAARFDRPAQLSGEPSEQERALRELEARLDIRERELALVRQGLDAERNALLAREREVRNRELAELRQSFGTPLAPPGFAEGLAAFVSSRRRR
jgi:DNA repair exonuclease SbcCD ATPase subunit